jgi:hypothetical protein
LAVLDMDRGLADAAMMQHGCSWVYKLAPLSP